MLTTSPIRSYCSTNIKSCAGSCSGYGTRTQCPPLIVIAVLSSSEAAFPKQRSHPLNG